MANPHAEIPANAWSSKANETPKEQAEVNKKKRERNQEWQKSKKERTKMRRPQKTLSKSVAWKASKKIGGGLEAEREKPQGQRLRKEEKQDEEPGQMWREKWREMGHEEDTQGKRQKQGQDKKK